MQGELSNATPNFYSGPQSAPNPVTPCRQKLKDLVACVAPVMRSAVPEVRAL
jgi:hypothetical protein